jgi:catechol 2,3-dioxygenase-like lactoylglutathione lyase family enzyme
MIRAIDHIVIVVHDLAAASEDYAALGFTVTPGGEHTDRATHNALVVFGDDSYLELIAFLRPAPQHRWWHHTSLGEGLVDFALLPTAIEDDIAAARKRGLSIAGPTPGGRLRPDRQKVAWQLGSPATRDMPFLCADVTPRDLRVPRGGARQHANGVAGVAGLIVAVADFDASRARYRALLGAEERAVALPPYALGFSPEGAQMTSFALGRAAVVLAAPAHGADPSADLSNHLATRGEGPYALALRAGAAAADVRPGRARTHGVRMRFVAE